MTTPTSAAVEAVHAELAKIGVYDSREQEIVFGLIAAVLDNMPRGVMAQALRREVPQVRPFSLEAVDAIIAAARKELLGHD